MRCRPRQRGLPPTILADAHSMIGARLAPTRTFELTSAREGELARALGACSTSGGLRGRGPSVGGGTAARRALETWAARAGLAGGEAGRCGAAETAASGATSSGGLTSAGPAASTRAVAEAAGGSTLARASSPRRARLPADITAAPVTVSAAATSSRRGRGADPAERAGSERPAPGSVRVSTHRGRGHPGARGRIVAASTSIALDNTNSAPA